MTKDPTILYEDSDVVVIDKPAGLMVHPDGVSKEKTLVDWILAAYPDMRGVGEPLDLSRGKPDDDQKERLAVSVVERPGIVHRLDKETSGVLILARTPAAHVHLKDAFMNREAVKTYRAFLYGIIKEDRGSVDKPIGKSRTDFRQWSAARNPRGVMREAHTDFKVLLRSPLASYVEAYPKTGRTHQIRVHFKAIHHPVVADALYAAGKPHILGFTRLALHSKSLMIELPSGEKRTFEAPLPPDFIEGERQLRAEIAA